MSIERNVETLKERLEKSFSELISLLDGRQFALFSARIHEMNPVDIADFLEQVPDAQLPTVLGLLKKDVSAEVFAELDGDMRERVVASMTAGQLSSVFEELYLDDAAEVAKELPANLVHRLMKSVTPETRAQINRILSYPEDSAGSIMNAEFVSLRVGMTCAAAIDHIRSTGVDKETVYNAYVTDRSRILLGTVSFKDLLFADPSAEVGEIMDESVIFVRTHDDRELASDTVSKYGLLALPVVDRENRLVGIITVDDAVDVIIEETTEDIEIMAAITPGAKPYLRAGVFETFKQRIPWLLLLMISAIFTGAIITHYESAIGTYAILAAFFPMLMGTGGNAGSQTSVTVIRGMSLDEIAPRDVLRVLWKEFRVSLLCGVCLGVACFIKTMLIDFGLRATTVLDNGVVQNNVMIAVIVSLTAVAAVIIAKMIGALLPMGAKGVGLDPAVMASPFITTIVDAVTLIVYFAIASKFLPL